MPDRSPETGPDDPIKSNSFALPLLIASFLLIVTVAWSFYVEFYGLRPWREYQSRFAKAYSSYLAKAVKDQKKSEERFTPRRLQSSGRQSRRCRKDGQSARRRHRQTN